MEIGNPQGDAELNSKVSKNVCAHVCTAYDFFLEKDDSFFPWNFSSFIQYNDSTAEDTHIN